MPFKSSLNIPMIATRDVAEAAAMNLLDPDLSGHSIVELHGPRDLTFKEVATILSSVTGRKISYNQISMDKVRSNLINTGMPDSSADMMIELYTAINEGRLTSAEPRTAQTTTKTTIDEFGRGVLKPAMGMEAAAG
jgi:uncharacterized protein YbjT (DUF2867 family)